jgi:hypothetical protein
MGALNQLGSAVSNFVAAPAASISNALAQADKDLSLSQNALPILGAGALAASSGLIPGIPGVFGGAAGTGAGLSALDAGMGAYGTASAMPAALGGGAVGLSALDAGMGAYGAGSTIGGAGTAAATGGLTASQALTGANLLRNIFGGTGMATTAQQQALGSLLGGLLQQAGGAVQGGTSAAAAEEQARMISDATQRAVSGSQFRPIGTTTRFGTSQFQVDPVTGQLTSAGYTISPELKAMQDRIMALSSQGLTEAEQAAGRYAPLTAGAQSLFGLGQQYLAQTPEQVAADYMARQQSLLAPSREREFAQLQNRLFQTGRGGLSVGGTGMRPGGGEGLRAASPEMEAYYNALAQQDAALAAQAQQAGQQQVGFGAGLFGKAGELEQLAQSPFALSTQLANLGSTAGARAGTLGLEGSLRAAGYGLRPELQYSRGADVLGALTSPTSTLGQGIGGLFGGLFGGGNVNLGDTSGLDYAYGGGWY